MSAARFPASYLLYRPTHRQSFFFFRVAALFATRYVLKSRLVVRLAETSVDSPLNSHPGGAYFHPYSAVDQRR